MNINCKKKVQEKVLTQYNRRVTILGIISAAAMVDAFVLVHLIVGEADVFQ
ncbi:MAG: hypothetical protein U0X87_17145 [Anaerolineales bacterium]